MAITQGARARSRALTLSSRCDELIAQLPSRLVWVFLFFALPTVLFLSISIPPFQNADEYSHFERSFQVSRGGFLGRSGGYVDNAVGDLNSIYDGIGGHVKVKLTEAKEAAAERVRWTGQGNYHDFSNTTSYPPVGYLPQAAGIDVGRMLRLSAEHTLMAARLFNAACAIVLSCIALMICRRGRLLLLVLLLLPMTLSLFASCSQDASMIAMCALAFAIVSRCIDDGVPASAGMAALLCALLLVCAMQRPPYAALFLVLLVPGVVPLKSARRGWLKRSALCVLLMAATAGWWLFAIALSHLVTNGGSSSGIDPKLQLLYLLHHGRALPLLIATSVRLTHYGYMHSFVGTLGWLDTGVSHPEFIVVLLSLLVAFGGEACLPGRFRAGATAIIWGTAAVTSVAVFLIEYLIWTKVGASAIDGIQGRYFIPIAIAASAGVPRLARSRRAWGLAAAFVVACQFATLLCLPWLIIQRYYLR